MKSQIYVRCCLVLSFFVFSAISQTAQAVEDREIVIGEKIQSDEMKKTLYYAEYMKRVANEYDQSPERFMEAEAKEFKINYRQPGKDEVLRKAHTAISSQLDGWDIKNEPVAKVVSLMVNTFGGPIGSIAVGAFELLPAMDGHTPSDEGENLQARVHEMLELADQSDNVGNRVHERLKNKFDFNSRQKDFSNDPALQRVKTMQTAIANSGAQAVMAKAVGRIESNVEHVKNTTDEMLAKMTAAEDSAEAQRQFIHDKAELEGTFSTMGYALQLMGQPEMAQFSFQLQSVGSKLMDLSAGSMGPMALTSGYIGVAIQVYSMLKSSKAQASAQQMMMEQLMQIMKMIDNLRKEMHSRFDNVDVQLSRIFAVSVYGIGELSKSLDELHRQALEAKALIDQKYLALNRTIRDYNRMDYQAAVSRCQNYRRGNANALTDLAIQDCFNLFDRYGNEFSIRDLFVNNALSDDLSSSPTFEYAGSQLFLAGFLIQRGASDLRRGLSLSRSSELQSKFRESNKLDLNLPNAQMWVDNSREFLSFIQQSDRHFSKASEEDFKNFLQAGRDLDFFYRHLLFDSAGTLRTGVIDSVLSKYRDVLKSTTQIAESEARRHPTLAEANEPDFHVGRAEQDLKDYVIDYYRAGFNNGNNRGNKMQWCDDKRDFKLHQAYFAKDLVWEEGPIQKVVPDEWVLKPESQKFINSRVQLAELLGLGKISACISNIQIHETSQNGYTNPNLTKYQVSVRVDFLDYANKQIFKVNEFLVHSKLTITPINPKDVFRMLWIKKNFDAAKNPRQEFPMSEALVDPAQMENTSLMSPTDSDKLEKMIATAFRLYRSEQKEKIFIANTENLKNKQNGAELMLTLNALIKTGLEPHLNSTQKSRLSAVLDPKTGLPSVTQAADLVFVNGLKPEEVDAFLDYRIQKLRDYLNELAHSQISVRSHPMIEVRLQELQQQFNNWKQSH